MITHEDIRIAVFGLGHVGLPTALGFAELGWDVIGVENDPDKASLIEAGNSWFYERGLTEILNRHLETGTFRVETDVSQALNDANVLFVCVGTPQREDGAADLSVLESLAQGIGSNLDSYKLVVEKSTTPVNTAQQLRASITRHARSSKPTGANTNPHFDIAVNPEFLQEGRALDDFFNPDRIVLGVESERAQDLLMTIYKPLVAKMGSTVDDTVIITDINTAEIIKHASNAFLATKISFINMISDLCDVTGADVTHVARGLGMDHRIGPAFLNAGLGYGGYCLPKDLKAFSYIASRHGVDFSFLEEVERINTNRINNFLEKARQALWVLKGKTIAVWGLSFKPETDDIRDAPSIGVVSSFVNEQARLRLYDPKASGHFKALFPQNDQITYCDAALTAVEGADALLVVTEWSEFLEIDIREVADRMNVPLIIDGRNVYDPDEMRKNGFEYHGLGRH
ncbi:MAG: UDP-glucose/GDP-mannose dehydrogenase family protein [SAR202 cluster bacterium]|nr:UDP-glucose/GDP-mannose dehydrogenase family protein [SAR202 cluster bacterium]